MQLLKKIECQEDINGITLKTKSLKFNIYLHNNTIWHTQIR